MDIIVTILSLVLIVLIVVWSGNKFISSIRGTGNSCHSVSNGSCPNCKPSSGK